MGFSSQRRLQANSMIEVGDRFYHISHTAGQEPYRIFSKNIHTSICFLSYISKAGFSGQRRLQVSSMI